MTISRTFGPLKLASTPAEELQNFLQRLPAAGSNPNNPLATGAMPSANPSAPQLNPHLPGSFTNPANPKLNPNMPGAITNPSNPEFNPGLPGAQNNPSNPQYNPGMPGAVNNPASPNLNPAYPGAFTNPANPINNPDFPTPSSYPPPEGLSPDASLPPSRWSSTRRAMAERSGFPELDAAIEEFMRMHPEIEELRDPQLAWGRCEEIAEQCAAFLKQRGFKAYAPSDDLHAFEGYQNAQDSAAIGAGEFSYPEHAVVEVYGMYGPNNVNNVYIDFTASQYGFTEFPKIEGGRNVDPFGPKHADNWQKDNRDWPDPTEPRMPKPPAPKGCTCHSGDKLGCPIHGLNADYDELDHTWALPEGQAVSYPQDTPRAWTDAFVSAAQPQVMYHVAPAEAAQAIAQQGLQPNDPGYGEMSPRGIYLFPDIDNAGFFADHMTGRARDEGGYDEDPTHHIYEVNTQGLPLEHDPCVTDDDEFQQEYPSQPLQSHYTTQPIPPERIRRIASGPWDSTVCAHCGKPMTEPKQLGNKWMHHCTYCGLWREVPTANPLLQLQRRQEDLSPYPDLLKGIGPERPWVFGYTLKDRAADADKGLMKEAGWPWSQVSPAPSPEEAAQGRMCYFHPERPAVAAEGFAAMCPECLRQYRQTGKSSKSGTFGIRQQ